MSGMKIVSSNEIETIDDLSEEQLESLRAIAYAMKVKSMEGVEEYIPKDNVWVKRSNINYAYINRDYRIRKESGVYFPFTGEDSENLIQRVVKSKGLGFNDLYVITEITTENVKVGDRRYSYSELLQKFTFVDGSPCGRRK